ncbi:NADH:flavin oxidoreductase [Armatimonas sp.]|uniref:NADH:flavin oxidoreductase n=1 Tax=Armatimonas sp. TaxID=1872638 RepID=UPI00286CDA67|nr:NADH:flavin oxidoreductase [Armatimonas sp.]
MTSLFSPLPLGGDFPALPNRIVMGPMTLNQATESGHMTDWIVDWYRRRAAGGTGTIIGAAVFVSQGGRGWANAVGIADDSYTDGWRRCVEAAHAHGALFGTQLFHGGAASKVALLGQQPVSASDWTREGFDPARALLAEEIEQIIEDFAAGARRSIEAGCDFVELHGAHGYLLHQFWRRDVNQRTDKWGDPLAFPSAVTEAVRRAIGPKIPLLYRFSTHADDPAAPNFPVTPESLRDFLIALEAAGVDAWDISCWRESRRGYFGTETLLSDWVRQFSSKPRIVAGNIMTPQEATDYINDGHAEAVALARALIVDAEWANKAQRGELPRPVLDDSWRVINQGTDPGG